MNMFPEEVTESLFTIVNYLAENHHPHTKFIIENGHVELVEAVVGFSAFIDSPKFLKEDGKEI